MTDIIPNVGNQMQLFVVMRPVREESFLVDETV